MLNVLSTFTWQFQKLFIAELSLKGGCEGWGEEGGELL